LLLSHGLLLGATPQRHASKMRAVGRKKSAYHQHSREEPEISGKAHHILRKQLSNLN